MELASKRVIKNLLKKYHLRPLKRMGQNFLIDRGVLKKIVKTANLQSKDIVLEIGPGMGTLTQELAKKVKKVIAVEKDPKMVEILKDILKNFKNIKIINKDVLKLEIWELFKNLKFKIKNFKIAANLPYYIVSPVIRKFIECKNLPKEMVLMVQKEVAQRICPRLPKPKDLKKGKTPKMNLLAVSVQFYAQPEIISYVSKKSFWPQPKVDSAIIKIVPHRAVSHQYLLHSAGFSEQFFKIVRSGFSQPRKQLINNFSKGLKLNKTKTKQWLLKNNIKPEQRAETLDIKDWLKLTKSFF